MMPRMTPMKIAVLKRLRDAGGSIHATDINGVWRSIASRMQGESLVSWEPPAIKNGRNCDGYVLHITQRGRDALAKFESLGQICATNCHGR